MAESFSILFVCTGNTCRSPMAEAIARKHLDALDWDHVEVASAGTSCFAPSAASEGALTAGRRHGLDLSEHRSQPLTPEVLDEADLVLTMTPSHLLRVVELGGGDRAAQLTSFAGGSGGSDLPPAVPDPFGGPDEAYEETFQLLEVLVDRTLLRLEPILNS